jgi:hypothetical protein
MPALGCGEGLLIAARQEPTTMAPSWIATTSSYPQGGAANRRTPTRCRVALSGADSAFAGAIGSLLHRRLRVVVLIALLPMLFFLVLDFVDPL